MSETPFSCSLCGVENADCSHAKHGIICQRCFDAQKKICDFCSSPEIAFMYPAATFATPIGTRSVTDWAACEPCAELIEAYQYEKLIERVIATMPDTPIAPMILIKDLVRTLHRQFWENRTGERIRIDN